MATVFIDRKNLSLKTEGNTLSLYVKGKKEGSIPINLLKRVVIVGNVKLETAVIHKLVKNQVSVLFLTGRLKYIGIIYGTLHNNGALRVKQYEKSLTDFTLPFAKHIIQRKIVAEIEFLREIKSIKPSLSIQASEAEESLLNILNLIESADSLEKLRGFEGSAHAIYFSVYTKLYPDSLNFNKRQKRPPTDPVNAMLSLCYTLLHFEIVREIQLIGLDPTIGFYHQFEYGRESLACDFVELFRVNVDRFVYEVFSSRQITARDFMKDSLQEGVYLKKSGRKKFYPLYESWINEIRPKLREEVRKLSKEILNEEDTLSC